MKRMLTCLCLWSLAGALQAAPVRIVALSWFAAENLQALGVIPLAVADLADYRRWVVRPALPASVLDAGSRSEPNLELLARLKPDLIVSDATLADLTPRLARLAPVLVQSPFASGQAPEASARTQLLQLARRLQREPEARARLAALDARLAMLRAQVAARYPHGAPAVCVVRMGSPTVVWLYGRHSMPQAAADAIGLRRGCPVATGAWGVAQRRVGDLAALGEATVLAVAPLEPAGRLWTSPLWQAMPFVRAGHFASLSPTWTYGGVFSLQYLAEAMLDGLRRVRG